MFFIITWCSVPRQNYGGFFATNRKCLNFLFTTAVDSVMKCCEKEDLVPGVCAVLHTFGGQLEFHPHIHILLTLGGLHNDNNFDFNVWKSCSFFPEKVLKTEFKRLLLKSLRKMAKEKLLNIPLSIKQQWWKKFKVSNFYEVSQKLWNIIWYVYIGERLDNAQYTTRYIGRYAKRPCLSETKINYYDKEKQLVVFTYKDKVSKTNKQVTLSVEEFISRLIRHIPEKNFRMIRYYGIYANAVKNKSLPILLGQIAVLYGLARLEFPPSEQPRNWRERITQLTGTDPLVCPNCNEQMKLVEIGYRARDGTFKTYAVYRF